MRRSIAILAAAASAAAATLLPGAPVSAHNCESDVVIFSYVSLPGGTTRSTPNSNALVCLDDTDADAIGYDGRIINPTATHVSVRYIASGNLGEKLYGTLVGLGVDQEIELIGVESATSPGVFTYDTESPLPIAQTEDPCITATIFSDPADPDETYLGYNTFHTFNPGALAPCAT